MKKLLRKTAALLGILFLAASGAGIVQADEPDSADMKTEGEYETMNDVNTSDDQVMSDQTAVEIPVTEIGDIVIGQTENAEAGTGCTVFICEKGMPAGLDVRGGGPASRESELLDPLAAAQTIHAIVLSGGSAYGLGTANGVMEYLEEHDIGYDTGVAKVPLVAQADLFDLSVADPSVRPDAAMGYEAARLAMEEPNYKDGNYGAGCGATVGKIAGMDTCMKTGIGSYAVQIGDLKIGAVVALNALGDVYNWKTGEKIAGLLTEDKMSFRDTAEYMKQSIAVKDNKFTGNTTLAVVMTNAAFSKSQLCKIAGMAHDGYARSIRPVHTSADGDSIYAVSIGDVAADQDLAGILAAEVVSEAIMRAAYNADSAYGYISAKDFRSDAPAETGESQALKGQYEASHVAEVNGISLHYAVAGEGKPVVLVHGNGESHDLFDVEISQLVEAGYRVYAPDSRGHGANAPLQEYHYADMSEDIYQFIQVLGLEKPAFYGHSDGGIIGLLLESTHPGTLGAMAVSGANLCPEGIIPSFIEEYTALNREKPDPLITLMLTEPHIDPENLHNIRIPVLVTVGENDLILRSETDRIVENLPDARLVVVEGADHGSYIDGSPVMGELLIDFLARSF